MNNQNQKPPPPKEPSPYHIAAGFLWEDRSILLPLLLILTVPGAMALLYEPLSTQYPILIGITKRIVDLSVLLFVCHRWIDRLQVEGHSLNTDTIFRFLSAGLGMWLLFEVPLLGIQAQFSPTLTLLAIFLFIPATIVALRYFFYFFPIVLQIDKVTEILAVTRSYTMQNRFLAVKALLAPLAIMMFLVALTLAISPDERESYVTWLKVASTESFWLLSTYLAVAFGFTNLKAAEWSTYGFKPEREELLKGLESYGPQWIGKILKPKNGVKIILLSLLIGVGNQVRLFNTPPSVTFNVQSIEIEGSTIRLTIDLTDEEFHFSGFTPFGLTLAGEKGQSIVQPLRSPQKVFVDGVPVSWTDLVVSKDTINLTLTVEFTTNRTSDSLKKLEDLHLWYWNARIVWLDMGRATVYTPTSIN